MQTAIIGGGNFGTAIANIIAANGHPTYLWMRDAQQAEEVERLRENRRYLPGHTLAPGITPTADLATAAAGADISRAMSASAVVLITVIGGLL